MRTKRSAVKGKDTSASIDGTKATKGASSKTQRSAEAGRRSSLVMSFMASATDWRSP